MRKWLVLLVAAAFAAGAGAQADPHKVLRVVFRVAETGFDPQAVSDLYSNYVNRVLFEPLFRYDFLARPHKIVPNTAVALPTSADGKEWTIKVKPGIYFIDDPAFKGKRRELTAADYAYSWKRIVDPKMRSPQLELFDGKIVGMDAVVAKARATGKFDYDAPVRRTAGRRPLHAAHQAQLPVVRPCRQPDGVRIGGRRARGHRGVR